MNLFEQEKVSLIDSDVVREELKLEYNEKLSKMKIDSDKNLDFSFSVDDKINIEPKIKEQKMLEEKLDIIENFKTIETELIRCFLNADYDWSDIPETKYVGYINEDKKAKLEIEWNRKSKIDYVSFDSVVSFFNDYHNKMVENELYEGLGDYTMSRLIEYDKLHLENKNIDTFVSELNTTIENRYGINIFETFDAMYRDDMKKYNQKVRPERQNNIDRICHGNPYLEEVIPDIMLDLDLEIDKINKKKEIINKDKVYQEIEFAIKACRVVDECYPGLLPETLDNFFKKMNENKYFSGSNIDATQLTDRITCDLMDEKNLFTYFCNLCRYGDFQTLHREVQEELNTKYLVEKIGMFYHDLRNRAGYHFDMGAIDFKNVDDVENLKENLRNKEVDYLVEELIGFKKEPIKNTFRYRIDNIVKEIEEYKTNDPWSFYELHTDKQKAKKNKKSSVEDFYSLIPHIPEV